METAADSRPRRRRAPRVARASACSCRSATRCCGLRRQPRAHARRRRSGIAVGAAVLAMTAVGSDGRAGPRRAARARAARSRPTARSRRCGAACPAQSNLSCRQLDRLARARDEPILGQPPFGVAVFRQATWGGAFVNLGAVDGLARWLDAPQRPRCRGRARRPTASSCRSAARRRRRSFRSCTSSAARAFKPGAPLARTSAAAASKRPPILLADGVLPFSRTPLPGRGARSRARTAGSSRWRRARSTTGSSRRLGTRLDRAQATLERRTDIFSGRRARPTRSRRSARRAASRRSGC